MSRPALEFREIRVRRMPGFRDGGFTLPGLGAGINLVHGPNASGKSTVARAVHALLWPGAASPARASLSAELAIDGHDWRIELDSAHVRCERDGAEATAPVIAPAETRDRYYLSLQDLLGLETGSDLAEVILRESSGGYDLSAAATALGFRTKPSIPSKERAAVKKAKEGVRRCTDVQVNLRDKERRLEQLERTRATAVADRDRIRWLELALEYRRALEKREGAKGSFELFALEIARLTGHEIDELSRIEQRKEEERRRRQVAHSHRDKARRARQRCGLPSKGIPGSLVPELRRRLQDLQASEQTRRERSLEVERLRAEETAERSRMGTALSDDQLEGLAEIGPEELTSLSDLAERMERLAAARAAVDELDSWVGCATPSGALDARKEAVSQLHRWLSAEAYDPADERRLRIASACGGAALFIGGVLVAILAHLAGVLAIAGGIGIALYGWWPRPKDNVRERVRGGWGRLGIAEPDAWTSEGVDAHLDQLHRENASDVLEQEKAARWAGLGEKVSRLEADLEEAKLARGDLVARVGLAPDTEHRSFVHLVSRIIRWQDLHTRKLGAIQARDEAASQQSALASEIERVLRPHGYSEGGESAVLSGAIDDLERRAVSWEKASTDMSASEREVEETERRIETAEQEIASLFLRCGLHPGEEVELRDRLDQMEAYREAHEAVRDAERLVDGLYARLSEHEELRDRPEAQLSAELERCREAEESIEGLDTEIGEIRSKLAEAKERHDLEESLAELDGARDQIRESRHDGVAAVVGSQFAEAIRRKSRDLERPRVFHRARELFTTITIGRYRLDLSDDDTPSFRAVDVTTGTIHTLDELSSATRVQLLLAVRVAFIEEQEQGPALPLLLDETLGNSDDTRAQSIIRAATEIARSGRQVFYFTAQEDEAGKWLGQLQDDDSVTIRTVDLAEARGLSESERMPAIPIQRPPRRDLPDPGGLDRLEFGRKLGVPPIDPRADSSGGIHLWHLIDDVRVLHRLLALDITRWGQLENLIRHGGRELVPDTGGVLQRAEAAAHVCEKASQYWKIGRGKPIDRGVLARSGAVSDTFLDEVAELAKAYEGSAERLLDALARKKVKRFPSRSVEKLREFLREQGYFDEAAPLTSDEIRNRVLAASSPFIREQVLSPDRVDELVASVPF